VENGDPQLWAFRGDLEESLAELVFPVELDMARQSE
jgi:hypothetical protein